MFLMCTVALYNFFWGNKCCIFCALWNFCTVEVASAFLLLSFALVSKCGNQVIV